MSKKERPGRPSEVPAPGKEPEIKPDIKPEEPVLPEEEPEIIPEKEPDEPDGPSPAEIPAPPPKQRIG